MQTDERQSHGVVERGASMRAVVTEIFAYLTDRTAVDEGADVGFAGDGIEGHKCQIVFLSLCELALCAADGANGFINTRERGLTEMAHRTALVNNNKIVNFILHTFF